MVMAGVLSLALILRTPTVRYAVGTTTGARPMAHVRRELGLRNVSFEVNDLQAAVDWAASEGYGLVGGIGEYEGAWRMAYVRGPEGIIVSLAERIADLWLAGTTERRDAAWQRRAPRVTGQWRAARLVWRRGVG